MRGTPDQPPPGQASIVGFDIIARAWIVDPGQATGRAPLPLLRGRLVVDVAAQEAYLTFLDAHVRKAKDAPAAQ